MTVVDSDKLKKAAKNRVKKTHPGFQAVQEKIANQKGISKDKAGAILAHATRHASKSAKKTNPRLKKVKG